MPATNFASRSQMGYLYHNKRDIYLRKLPAAMQSDVSRLPFKVTSKQLTGDKRAAVRNAHRDLKAGKITVKEFEKVFRDQFPRAAYVPTGQRRGRRLGAKDRKPRKKRAYKIRTLKSGVVKIGAGKYYV